MSSGYYVWEDLKLCDVLTVVAAQICFNWGQVLAFLTRWCCRKYWTTHVNDELGSDNVHWQCIQLHGSRLRTAGWWLILCRGISTAPDDCVGGERGRCDASGISDWFCKKPVGQEDVSAVINYYSGIYTCVSNCDICMTLSDRWRSFTYCWHFVCVAEEQAASDSSVSCFPKVRRSEQLVQGRCATVPHPGVDFSLAALNNTTLSPVWH